MPPYVRWTYPVNREMLQLLKSIFRDGQAQKQKGNTQVRIGFVVKRPGVHSKECRKCTPGS